MERFGRVRSVTVRCGMAGELWLGWERFCAVRSCMVWCGWHGSARFGEVRYGMAGEARFAGVR